MIQEQAIRVRDGADQFVFVIRPIISPESVVEAGERLKPYYFGDAAHLDMLFSMYLSGFVGLDDWRRVFAVGHKCRWAAAEPNLGLFKVWNLKLRWRAIYPYYEIHRPGDGAGILTVEPW